MEWNTKDLRKADGEAAKNINTYIDAANPQLLPYSAKKVSFAYIYFLTLYFLCFSFLLQRFPSRSDAVWNHAGTLLAVGNGDGTIELFDSNFRLLKKFSDHRKLINRIRWHPGMEIKRKK